MVLSEVQPVVVSVPLTEAVIDVRFPGDASIDGVRGAFQREIGEDLPNLRVPKAKDGEALALMPYLFTDERLLSSVGLSLNQLFYSTREYPGWEGFRERFMRYWRTLAGLADLDRLTRVGMRYTNTFEEDALGELLEPERIPYLQELVNCASSFALRAVLDRGDAQLLVDAKYEGGHLILAYDAFMIERSASTLHTDLEILHSHVEQEFLSGLVHEIAERLKGQEA